jgi:glycosylphosphatidylinositol deacylase
MVAPFKPADFFTIDLNEDFSALHGPTLAAQRDYATAAVSYILSLYPQGTQVVLLGHSMGGIVATSMLPNRNISALITMATPHTLPPARFDRRIEELYAHNAEVLAYDPIPIVSLCGGATDTLVPSESCIIPDHDTRAEGSTRPYRRTVFASALEGAWTGVGHQVIVWCHQVRWRVARAILDLSATTDNGLRAKALDKWLSAEPTLQTRPDLDSAPVALDKGKMVTDTTLRVEHPKSSQTYMFPIPEEPSRFTLLVSSGSVPPIAPQKVGQLTINVLYCSSTKQCTPLRPDTHQLLPRPVIGKAFPTPKEGSDESAGIVLFETSTSSLGDGYIAIRVTSADDTGAFAAGFSPPGIVKVQSRAFGWASVSSGTTLKLSPSLSIHQTVPSLLSHAMLVWRATPVYANAQSCKDSDALLHPLLTLHSPHEAHHYPLHPSFPVPLLHTHAGAPFLTSPTHGLNITIRSSGEPACAVEKLVITLDIWSTIGRWGARLWPAIASSAIGVVALLVFDALAIAESSSGEYFIL